MPPLLKPTIELVNGPGSLVGFGGSGAGDASATIVAAALI